MTYLGTLSPVSSATFGMPTPTYFDAAIAPVLTAVRGNLVRWVEDNLDALVRAFTSEDDAVVVVAHEGDVVDDDDGGVSDGGDDADEDDDDASDASVGDVASDISG